MRPLMLLEFPPSAETRWANINPFVWPAHRIGTFDADRMRQITSTGVALVLNTWFIYRWKRLMNWEESVRLGTNFVFRLVDVAACAEWPSLYMFKPPYKPESVSLCAIFSLPIALKQSLPTKVRPMKALVSKRPDALPQDLKIRGRY